MNRRKFGSAAILLLLLTPACWGDDELKVGAAAVDITPPTFPVIVNGMFEERSADRALDRLHARALVFADGKERAAIVLVDSCVIPRDVCDAAKELAAQRTGIPADHICIAATHTHSAPSVAAVLGSRADAGYTQFIIPQIARSIEQAAKNVQPAEIGYATVRDEQRTHCRRWIRRFDRLAGTPFGEEGAKAHMHPGYQNPDAIGPSGPTDPDISILAVRGLDGTPIAVLANYSMHYFGSGLLSADYYGKFCDALGKLMGHADGNGPFVAIMSQGTSGDLYLSDYDNPPQHNNIDEYSQALAQQAYDAIQKMQFDRGTGGVAVREAKLTLNRRVGDEKRQAWAKAIVEKIGDRIPQGWPEIYANEAMILAEHPTAELKLQAIRIGDVCIATWPNEVYALSGLKLKQQSPCEKTFNIELANGSEGYIPPPEQHTLGGYTTWPARTAGLEVTAEPKILEQLLTLLESVTGKPRRALAAVPSPAADKILANKPVLYWPMNDIINSNCADASGNKRPGEIEPKVALYLSANDAPGHASDSHLGPRAFHFAGGRVKRAMPELGDTYTTVFRFWNGLPADLREVTSYLFSRGEDSVTETAGDHLGIGGTTSGEGKLFFYNGNEQNELLIGKTPLDLKRWYQVALVRNGSHVKVYLDGKLELEGDVKNTVPAEGASVFFGGRIDGFAPLEGKINDAAIYDHELTEQQLQDLAAVPYTVTAKN